MQYHGKNKDHCTDRRTACQASNRKKQQQKAYDKTLIRNTVSERPHPSRMCIERTRTGKQLMREKEVSSEAEE
jgi:hypothetical protein